MAEFLASGKHISIRVEDTISGAKEFVYLASPDLLQIPQYIFNKLYEALGRKVRIFLMYQTGSLNNEEEISKLQQLRGISLYCHDRIHVNVCLNEKEAVIGSLELSGARDESKIDFGVYFRKSYAAEMHEKLLGECKQIQRDSVKTMLHEGKLIERAQVEILQPKKELVNSGEAIEPTLTSKKLTAKEKQSLIVQLFAQHCPECVIKIEDHDRVRVQGRGVVVFTNKERVELIFIRYDQYNARKDEVKEYISARHPQSQVWCTYNRITFNVDKGDELSAYFLTVKDALTSMQLV